MTIEVRSEDVLAWIALQRHEHLVVSDWVVTEFSAALSVKLRTAQIDAAGRALALQHFARMCAESLPIIPVSRSAFLTAARFSDAHHTGLRASDALHLAIAAEHMATISTLDRRLASSGITLGVRTYLI